MSKKKLQEVVDAAGVWTKFKYLGISLSKGNKT
jgi:hypothetical protein